MDLSLQEIFILTLYTIIFSVFVLKYKRLSDELLTNKILLSLFLLKLCFGALYLWIYVKGQKNDAYDYFYDSVLLTNQLYNKPIEFLKVIFGVTTEGTLFNDLLSWSRGENMGFYNDDKTIVKINMLFRPLNFGSYFINSWFYVVMSFFGALLIYKTFSKILVTKKRLVALSVFGIPSVMFWTSMASKEVVTFLFLGLFFYFSKKLLEKISVKHLLLFTLALILVLHIKIYIKVSIVVALIYAILHQFNFFKRPITSFIIVSLLVVTSSLFLDIINYPLNPIEILEIKRKGFVEWMAMDGIAEDNKSTFTMLTFKRDAITLTLVFFEALFNIAFRPLITHCYSFTTYFVSIENILVFFSLLILAFNRQKQMEKQHLFWLFYLLLFVILSSAIVGITVPNAGALVRYKSVVTPFMVLIFVTLADEEKLKRLFNKL